VSERSFTLRASGARVLVRVCAFEAFGEMVVWCFMPLCSGLAAAYRLRQSGVNVTVFEAADRAGGKIRTNSEGGFVWDEGANTMVRAFRFCLQFDGFGCGILHSCLHLLDFDCAISQ
jgi:hypothetical protein